jgi:two-component system response regulator MprA
MLWLRLGFSLPMKRQQPVTQIAEASSSREGFGLMAATKRLLVIDDQIAIVQLLEELLTEEGYEVEGITDSVEALERVLRPPRPDLLILDLMMPQVTGWEVLETLRSNPATATVPVILLTAAPRQGQVELNQRNPSLCILLAKPIGLDELLMQIESMLSRSPRQTNDTGHQSTSAESEQLSDRFTLHHWATRKRFAD